MFWLVMFAARSEASTYYLSTSGVDQPDAGLTLGTAWRSFSFALPQLRPGDRCGWHPAPGARMPGALRTSTVSLECAVERSTRGSRFERSLSARRGSSETGATRR